MKIKNFKMTETIQNVTVREAINVFFDNFDWYPDDEDGSIEDMCNYIDEEVIDATEEEQEELLKALKEEYHKRVEDLRQEELAQLSSRSAIIDWLSNVLYDRIEWGTVGYILNYEEIIDEIIKNGRK